MPIWAIEPASTAVLAVRWQSSRAISGVSLASGFWSIIRKVCWICWSETRLRKGDCSSCTERPWRSVPSNTGSPVEFVKSARTMVSLSVRAWVLVWERNNHPPHSQCDHQYRCARDRRPVNGFSRRRRSQPSFAAAASVARIESRFSRCKSERMSPAIW